MYLLLKENFKLENLEVKVDLCIKSKDSKEYHYTTTKDVLGKLTTTWRKGSSKSKSSKNNLTYYLIYNINRQYE
jgi:hypothetical protein